MNSRKTDHWSSSTYQASAAYVPKLTSKVYALLDPQPGERILDIGCGDGVLTARIAQAVASSTHAGAETGGSGNAAAGGGGGFVLGLDASPSMIAHAQATYASQGNLRFEIQDCAALPEAFLTQHAGSFDKIFSNAALHWILGAQQPATTTTTTTVTITSKTSKTAAPSQRSQRISTLRALHSLLKANSRSVFVFEMGGAGNVAEAHAALTYALVARGISLHDARACNPWFFPSARAMAGLLAEAGFDVRGRGRTGSTGSTDVRDMRVADGDADKGDEIEDEDEVDTVVCEYRATRLEEATSSSEGEGGDEGKAGGLAGWIRLMGAAFLERLPEQQREEAVLEVCGVLRDICARDQDEGGYGGEWLGYVRCRGVARRSAS